MALSQKAARRLAWSVWSLGPLLAGVGLLLIRANRGSIGDDALIVPVVLTMSGVGALIASKRPGNAIGWLLLTAGSGAVVGFVLGEFASYAAPRGIGPRWFSSLAAWLSAFVWLPSMGLVPTFLILLFPDGRLPSPRWRLVAGLVAGSIAVAMLVEALRPGPLGTTSAGLPNPAGVRALAGVIEVVEAIVYPVLVVCILLCFAGLVTRFVRSRGEERQQIRWFLLAAGVSVLSFALGDVLPDVLGEILFWGAIGGLAAAIGIGVLKYRLYEIDLVVRKTLVYALLAAVVTGVYLLVVVAIPAVLFQAVARPMGLVVIAATALLTVALLPLRRRMTHVANRLVYGKRATPYEVLSEFAGRMGESYSVDDVLPRMARVLGEGTGAERAEVLLGQGEALQAAAVWPPEAPPGQADVLVTVSHRGEQLGALSVRKPRGEPITPAEEKLAHDLASQAGLVLRNVALFEDLRASRRRLVEAQDAERRRLERDIHDGAQQQLVAMAVKLRLLEGLTEKDPARARSLAAQIKEEAGAAIETLRDLARGIYPPLLADEGLPAALTAQARKGAIPVEVHPDGVGRYPQEVEAAVYFCVLEALQNVAKYAEASRVDIRLSAAGDELRFEVVDDGRGFEVASARRGSGTQNMSDRLEALGGSLEIRSAPGEGTTVAGTVPAGSAR